MRTELGRHENKAGDSSADRRNKLTVVLGTRNRLDFLKQCLDSIRGKIAVDHEIIVADAGSTDGSIEYLKSLDDVRLVEDGEPIGQAKSLNRIFRQLTSEYVCWISDDNVVTEGSLDRAVQIMDQNPKIGMLGLKVKDVLGQWVSAGYIGGIWPSGILNVNQGLIRVSVLKEVDYFDEEFRDYGIDADLTTKVLLAGHQVAYTKEVVIHHYRDHETAPGAIGSESRTPKLERAHMLYSEKYERIFRTQGKRTIHQHGGVLLWRFYKSMLKVKALMRRHPAGLFRHEERDWHNVAHCAYIDKLDLWRNRNEPFYLVQEIKLN